MASINNRAPFHVVPRAVANASHEQKFRSRPAAETYKQDLASKGIPASIVQAETGYWEAEVRRKDGQGKLHPKRERFHTKQQAEAWAKEQENVIVEVRDKKLSLTVNQTPWSEAVELWYAVEVCGLPKEQWNDPKALELIESGQKKSKLAGQTVIKYSKKRIIDDFGPETLIGDITIPVVREWRDKLLKDGYAPSTIANYRQIVSGTIKYFISEKDFVGVNPCRQIKWPKPDNAIDPPKLADDELMRERKDEDEFDDGTRDEIPESDEELLLKTIGKQSPWLVPIVKFGLETAARRSEILRLEWEHIDFKNGELRIIKEKNDHKKSNGEQKGRTLPFWPELEELLNSIQPDKSLRRGRVFEGTASSCTHSFAEAVKKLGWTDLTFHSLRKIATGRLSKMLPNVVELSHVTGHRDLQTLAKRYYGVDLKDLAAKISNHRRKATPNS